MRVSNPNAHQLVAGHQLDHRTMEPRRPGVYAHAYGDRPVFINAETIISETKKEPMKKLLLILVILAVSCTPESYSEKHLYKNEYFLVNRNAIDSLKVLYPNDETRLYKEDGSLNREAFQPVENDGLIWFNADTLFVRGQYDHFYYAGDKTTNQIWISEADINYLKMNLPVPGEHLLSVSVNNRE